MRAVKDCYATAETAMCGRNGLRPTSGRRGCRPHKGVEQERRSEGSLWPGRADSDSVMRRGVRLTAQHGAVVLAVTAAAGRKAGVWILRECQPRRDERKREGSEQQDGKKATHYVDGFSVRPGSLRVSAGSFICWDADRQAAVAG